MTLVAGVDSSTQSCKVVVCDATSGAIIRSGSAPHPVGTEVDPADWLAAFELASARAGGIDDVAALAIGAQQHGMVCIDDAGHVVRPAVLWNDVRSAPQAAALIEEFGGPQDGAHFRAEAVGSVPVASFTVTKLRWLAEHEPDHAAATAAVCLPHDWLTWRLGDRIELDGLATDRGDASGTGYFSPATGEYRIDLLAHAFGRKTYLPSVRRPAEPAGQGAKGALLGCGTGDNAAAALGIGAVVGDVVVSIGTSGTAFAVSDHPTADASGTVAGFADATGRFLPLTATLNAARVLDATVRGYLASTTTDCRRSRSGHRSERADSSSSRTSKASAHRTGRSRPARCMVCVSRTGRRQISPVRRSKACSVGSPQDSTPSSARACVRSG